MNLTLSSVYSRYKTLAMLLVAGLIMVLSFLWYLPGAYRATDMGSYHSYTFRELRFNNVIAMYVNHNLQEYDGPGFILDGTGIEYPALLSMLIRGTAGLGVSDERALSGEAYRIGTPPPTDETRPSSNVVAYTLVNYAVVFVFGLLAMLLMARWRGARPWLFAASPLLFLFAGYNWDLVPIALTMGGLLLLEKSVQWGATHPGTGRGYNLALEVAGWAVLTVAVWFKLFPIVFMLAALIMRGRHKMWHAAGVGVGVIAFLSLLINLPLALSNFDSWRFFLWIHQHRASEPSIWYWLIGGMDPATVNRGDVTATINIISLAVVAGGGLVIMALGWRSPRWNFAMPMGCLLLVWWLYFNKVYDPNFDLWLLFVLAILGAPLWLYTAVTLMSISWYLLTFVGLHISGQPNSGDFGYWFVTHPFFAMLVLRLIIMLVMILWLGWVLLTPGEAEEQEGQEAGARPPLPTRLRRAVPTGSV